MNTVCIRTYGTRLEAEYAKNLLQSNDIPSYIQVDDAGGAYPFPLSASGGGVRLFVINRHKSLALKILRS
jgi:hypothetical protein